MKKKLLAGLATGVLGIVLTLSVSSATATTIDFEVGQTGNSGHISGDFRSAGVIFTRVGTFDLEPPPLGTGTAAVDNLTYYKDNTQGFAYLSPDYSVGVGGVQDGSTHYGTIRASFVLPNTSTQGSVDGIVSVWLGDASAELDNVSLQAFDSTGQLLAFDNGQINNGGTNTLAFVTLSISSSHIAYMLISANHPVSMDNFIFNTPVSGNTPVPEPATMLLFGAGIAGLAGTRLRRKK